MKTLSPIPTFISSLRIAALPLFFYLFNQGNVTACLILLAFCAATDFFDGYLARKLEATSRFGAYYDATTDFILMIGIFAIFYAHELLSDLVVDSYRRIVHSILSHKPLRQKTLRPRGKVPWKRPLHWSSLNSALANTSSLRFCPIRLRSVLSGFLGKPNSKFEKKKSLD